MYSKFSKAGKKDKVFIEELKKMEGHVIPGMFSDEIDKAMFGMVYYGWLMATHGTEKAQSMIYSIKAG